MFVDSLRGLRGEVKLLQHKRTARVPHGTISLLVLLHTMPHHCFTAGGNEAFEMRRTPALEWSKDNATPLQVVAGRSSTCILFDNHEVGWNGGWGLINWSEEKAPALLYNHEDNLLQSGHGSGPSYASGV